MKYEILRNENYDFIGESYKNLYPNIHKYPATMLPQIGIKILKELGVGKNSKLLDPYCGSGSSFSAGLEVGIKYMKGYDLNPLAVLICKAKFTKISLETLERSIQYLREQIYEYLKFNNASLDIPKINNLNFWFKDEIIKYAKMFEIEDRLNDEISSFANKIAELDIFCSHAVFAFENKYIQPEMNNSNFIEIV